MEMAELRRYCQIIDATRAVIGYRGERLRQFPLNASCDNHDLGRGCVEAIQAEFHRLEAENA